MFCNYLTPPDFPLKLRSWSLITSSVLKSIFLSVWYSISHILTLGLHKQFHNDDDDNDNDVMISAVKRDHW